MSAQTIFNKTQTTGTENVDFDIPEGYRGAVFVLDITAKVGTLTHDVKVQFLDPLSGKAVDVPGASFAQKSATGTSALSIYPGLTAATNVAVTQVLTKNLRVVSVVAGTTPSSTFTLTVHPVR
jgi:hypothetical protein